MTARRLEIFIIIAIIAAIGIVYALTQKPVLAPTNEATNQNQQVPTSVIEYQGVEGRTALSLLKASHNAEVKSYSFGDLVTGIDGISPDSNHFWAMYVNGQFSQVGAGQYVTKNSDLIKWQIEEIKY